MKKFFTITIIFVILFMVSVFIYQQFRHDSWYENREVVEYRVHYGDTLYDLGYEHKPSWMDVREWCYEVCKLNNMGSSDIYAGQIIKIYAPCAER